MGKINVLTMRKDDNGNPIELVSNEVDTEEYIQQAYIKSFRSHEAVKGHLIELLDKQHWTRIPTTVYNVLTRPDLAFRQGNAIALVEIKPSTAKIREIERAIGQVLIYLLHGHYGVIVCDYEWWELLRNIAMSFKLKKLIVLCYDSNGKWHRMVGGINPREVRGVTFQKPSSR